MASIQNLSTKNPIIQTTTPVVPPSPPTITDVTSEGYRLPEINTILHTLKLSITEDKPIMMDYWTNSLDKTALIGVKDNGEKLLVKSEEEYTSNILKICKSTKEYIIMTENSIYLIDANIPIKRISN